MHVRIINGKVHDADGRLLWIHGETDPGRPMTAHDLLLAHVAELPIILATHGHHAATKAAESNLGMDIWGANLRARLATRQATTTHLPASAPCRWVAEQLAGLLDGPLLWDGAILRGRRLWFDQAERARGRLEARMEVLYEVVEHLLDRTEPVESEATVRARTADC
jgi:hypothetical protein